MQIIVSQDLARNLYLISRGPDCTCNAICCSRAKCKNAWYMNESRFSLLVNRHRGSCYASIIQQIVHTMLASDF